MAKTLIIAEKPAMGRDIAQALSHLISKPVNKKGLSEEVGNYTVIGAQGHLYALSEPEAYGADFAFPWRVEPLPVLPDEFKWELNLEKERGKVKSSTLNDSIKRRAAEIAQLVKGADTIIHAGDPDREGQLIIDNILRVNHFKGSVQRLWLHAQTQDGILDAWAKLKNNTEYKNLGIAALARAESDWAIGMNSTRAYTALWWKVGNKGVLNVGRVTTPVVAMIVDRERLISSFVPVKHYSLNAQINIPGHSPFNAAWVKPVGEPPAHDLSGKLLLDRSIAVAAQTKCDGAKAAIKSIVKKPGKEPPPLLFSLVELQKMAAKMGHSPDAVLAAAQTLYSDLKLLSYPRTECQYAPESEHTKSASTIKCIIDNFGASWNLGHQFKVGQKSRVWDDKKLAEHFAIIPLPTKMSIDSIPAQTKNRAIVIDVYKLVCRQYLAQFLPDFEYLSTTINTSVAGELFRSTGKVAMVDGWKVLYGGGAVAVKKSADDDESQDILPAVNEGDTGAAKPVNLLEKLTEPPKRYTAITLLEAMEKAHQYVTDPEVKKRLKQVEGLGTAATRAAVISKIVKAQFVNEEKVGKVISYVPTNKAFTYADCIPSKLTKPDLTAWFEGKLEDLAAGSLEYSRYRELLVKLVNASIEPAKDGSFSRTCHKVSMPELSKPKKKTTKKVSK